MKVTTLMKRLPHTAAPSRVINMSTRGLGANGKETRIKRVLWAVALCAAAIFGGATPLNAQAVKILQYRGGPILSSFTIYPLYYGNWGDTSNHQNYLKGLAAYMSGQNAPAGKQPMMWQYGVHTVSVAGAKTAMPTVGQCTPSLNHSCTLADADIKQIIKTSQTNGTLPGYGPGTLIMVFVAQGFDLNCGGCGYHASESPSSFYAVVPQYSSVKTLQLVTGHEVFEAAADPADNHQPAWDEAVDDCPDGDVPSGSWIYLSSFGWIPGVHDNTLAGACSTTGYTSLSELQDYGVTYSQYRSHYDQLWPQGWRLYTLDTYVSNGQVLYNAVWRPYGNTPEIQLYGTSYAAFRGKYDQLWSQGWRLYILQSYVLNNQVLYNAVWRPGNVGETQDYSVSYAQYRADYDRLWPQGWRLYILQSYVLNGQVLYNAVWRPGQTGEIQAYGCSYSEYRYQYDQLWSQGWRLYLLQSYVLNGQTLYNAVWRPGNSGETQVYGWPYADYRRQYDTLWAQGWRLYSLETYVVNGSVLYNAVWRPGTLDRPL